MKTIWIHFPDTYPISDKRIALCLRRIIDVCSAGLALDHESWSLKADRLNIMLMWDFTEQTRADWYKTVAKELTDYLMLGAFVVFKRQGNKDSWEFDRCINSGVVVAKSKRGKSVPKIENEKTIWITVSDKLWPRINHEQLQQTLRIIADEHHSSFSIE